MSPRNDRSISRLVRLNRNSRRYPLRNLANAVYLAPSSSRAPSTTHHPVGEDDIWQLPLVENEMEGSSPERTTVFESDSQDDQFSSLDATFSRISSGDSLFSEMGNNTEGASPAEADWTFVDIYSNVDDDPMSSSMEAMEAELLGNHHSSPVTMAGATHTPDATRSSTPAVHGHPPLSAVHSLNGRRPLSSYMDGSLQEMNLREDASSRGSDDDDTATVSGR